MLVTSTTSERHFLLTFQLLTVVAHLSAEAGFQIYTYVIYADYHVTLANNTSLKYCFLHALVQILNFDGHALLSLFC